MRRAVADGLRNPVCDARLAETVQRLQARLASVSPAPAASDWLRELLAPRVEAHKWIFAAR